MGGGARGRQRPLLHDLFSSPKKLTHGGIQPAGELMDDLQRRVPDATLDPADVGPVETASKAELLLGQARLLSEGPYRFSEGLDRFLGLSLRISCHARRVPTSWTMSLRTMSHMVGRDAAEHLRQVGASDSGEHMRTLATLVGGALILSMVYAVMSGGFEGMDQLESIVGLLSGAGGAVGAWQLGRWRSTTAKIPVVILLSTILGGVIEPLGLALWAGRSPGDILPNLMAAGLGTGFGYGIVFGVFVYGVRPLNAEIERDLMNGQGSDAAAREGK